MARRTWLFQDLGLRRGRRGQARPPPRSSCSPRPASSATRSRRSTRADADDDRGRARRARRDQGATSPSTPATRWPACRSRRRIAARVEGGDAPDADPVRAELRRPRRGRPPVGQARRAGAHQRHRPRRSTATRSSASSRSSAASRSSTPSSRPTARTSSSSARSRSRPRRRAAARPRSSTVAVPDAGAAGEAKVLDRHVEEQTGPKLEEAAVVVSGGRGLGEAENYDRSSRSSPSCSRARRARRVPSSTPAGCRTRTRSARPARP